MNGVEFFIQDLVDQPLQKLIMALDNMIIESHPAIHSKIRYGIPFYYLHSWFCYINPQKKGGVEWCFIHGQKLPNPYGVLQSKGRSMIAGIHLKNIEDLNDDAISFHWKVKSFGFPKFNELKNVFS